MSEIYLTDVVIRCPPGSRNHIPDGASLFMFVDGKEVKRTEPFVREPTGRSWRLGENIEVSDYIPSTGLIVMIEYPNNDLEQLGFTELVSADLVSQYAGKSHGTDSLHPHHSYTSCQSYEHRS